MSNHVHAHFLARFLTLYGEPKTDNVEAFLGEYVRAMRGYSAEQLGRAADYLINNHRFKSWPTPAECREAVMDTEPPRPPPPPEPPHPEPSADERARVAAIVGEFRQSMSRKSLPGEKAN